MKAAIKKFLNKYVLPFSSGKPEKRLNKFLKLTKDKNIMDQCYNKKTGHFCTVTLRQIFEKHNYYSSVYSNGKTVIAKVSKHKSAKVTVHRDEEKISLKTEIIKT